MPRRGSGRAPAPPPRRASPSSSMRRPAPPPARAAPPAAAPAAAAPAAAAPSQGPGLMAQMAATAGGVAIGSAVGHTIGNMMGSGGGSAAEQAPAPQSEMNNYNQQHAQPCEFELKQFLDCANASSDVSMCAAFNDTLKECRQRNHM